MFQDYFRLAIGGLLLDQQIYDEQRTAPNGVVRGAIMIALVTFVVAVAALIGRVGVSVSTPPLDQIRTTVLEGIRQMPVYAQFNELDSGFEEDFQQSYDQVWQTLRFLDSSSILPGVANLIGGPLQALLLWMIGGAFAHLFARMLGGQGTMGQTLSCTALAGGANLLGIVAVIPFAQAAGIALLSLVATYVGVRTAHQLDPWRAFWSTIFGPALVFVIFGCIIFFVVASLRGALG